jgi:hypothetical protein
MDQGCAAQHGIVSAQGIGGVGSVIKALHEDQTSLPMLARSTLQGLVAQLRSTEVEIEKIDGEILSSKQRGEPAAGDHLRYRSDHGERNRRQCARRLIVPVRSPIRCLVGTDGVIGV